MYEQIMRNWHKIKKKKLFINKPHYPRNHHPGFYLSAVKPTRKKKKKLLNLLIKQNKTKLEASLLLQN